MSTVFPLIDGWVGYGDQGASILVETGTPIDADHPLVAERPELFTQPEKPALAPAPSTPTRGGGKPKATNG